MSHQIAKPLLAIFRDRLFLFALLLPLPAWLGLVVFSKYGELPSAQVFNFQLLLLVLVYPVLEEIVFRGLIQENLKRKISRYFGPVSAANLLTSLLFTALHFIYHSPLWAVSVFVPSLIFGFFRDRHNGLSAPIILHVFYNGGYYMFFG